MARATLDLHRKLQLALLAGVLLALLVAGIAVLSYELTTFRPRTAAQLGAVARVMADINQPALEFDDATLGRDNLGFLKLYPGVDAGALYRSDGSVFAAWSADGSAAQPSRAPGAGLSEDGTHASLTVPVVRDGHALGEVWVRQALPPLLKRLPQYAIMFGALALALVALGLLLQLSTQRVLTRPLKQLAQAAQAVRRTGDYTVRVHKSSEDEIAQLADDFNAMLAVIGERDAALQQAHDSLEQRVQMRGRELQQAMHLLMQREKLAALGNVVAGVAHELNTPIGNALLAATNLQQETQRMRGMLGGASVSRQDLEDYLDSVAEGSLIGARSLERAATLVHSFKSVAVNETSEARMPFELRPALEDCLALLAPGLRRKPVELHMQCPADIRCESYPGALTQIISNLVENAVRHGLEPQGGGRIDIVAKSEDDWVSVEVRDDGVGIPPEIIGHIFEPFFTTRLGQGGSGLGLHLVYNLATGPLAGHIGVRSEPGQGCCFTLRFPCRGPDPAQR